TGLKGQPLQRGTFRSRYWLPAVEKAGLTPLRFHDLRHTAAGIAHEHGSDLFDVKELLGHKDIQTTANIYLHLRENSQRLTDSQQKAFEVARSQLGRILDASTEGVVLPFVSPGGGDSG
ncbi:MAG TPA: tyrosine-type recombinase/integrase, partial [Actinomycetota bacterium]|nr:tyrosine-type recombinase/integrase [Actinomycetota bacterium]